MGTGFVDTVTVDVLKFHTLVARKKNLDRQGRPRSEDSVSIYYSDKHFVNSSLVLFVCVVALYLSQQFFSNVGMLGPFEIPVFLGRIN